MTKLRDVPRQLPVNFVNVVFLFHPSFAQSPQYLQQALFGDQTFFDDPHTVSVNSPCALYALDEWRKISALAWVKVLPESGIRCCRIWRNPNASMNLPEEVADALNRLE